MNVAKTTLFEPGGMMRRIHACHVRRRIYACRQDYTVGTRGRVSKGTCEHQLVITNSSSFFCFFMSFFFYMILPLCTERVKAPGYKERFK